MPRSIVAGVLALAACGGERGSPGPGGPAGPVYLRGAVAKGPFVRGSSVSVAPIDDEGTPTGDHFPTETIDDAGAFAVSVPVDGPVRLEASGFYYNEVTGRLSAAPITLRAYDSLDREDDEDGDDDDSGDEDGNRQDSYVNVFTHLVGRRVEVLLVDGVPLDEAVAQAEDEVGPALQIAPSGSTRARRPPRWTSSAATPRRTPSCSP